MLFSRHRFRNELFEVQRVFIYFNINLQLIVDVFYEAIKELNFVGFVNYLTEVFNGVLFILLTCFSTLLLPHCFLEHARHSWKP